MIDQKNINKVITDKLREVTGCEMVKSNLANTPIPPYPYISFTITNTETWKGTYGVTDGQRHIPLIQTWSITVQSDQDNEAQAKAMEARDWLEEAGRTYLSDHGIIVQSVGGIANRDNLLTLQYEYRKGFDVVLSLVNVIQVLDNETIERAELVKE